MTAGNREGKGNQTKAKLHKRELEPVPSGIEQEVQDEGKVHLNGARICIPSHDQVCPPPLSPRCSVTRRWYPMQKLHRAQVPPGPPAASRFGVGPSRKKAVNPIVLYHRTSDDPGRGWQESSLTQAAALRKEDGGLSR
jgi:hypothetical protein